MNSERKTADYLKEAMDILDQERLSSGKTAIDGRVYDLIKQAYENEGRKWKRMRTNCYLFLKS